MEYDENKLQDVAEFLGEQQRKLQQLASDFEAVTGESIEECDELFVDYLD